MNNGSAETGTGGGQRRSPSTLGAAVAHIQAGRLDEAAARAAVCRRRGAEEPGRPQHHRRHPPEAGAAARRAARVRCGGAPGAGLSRGALQPRRGAAGARPARRCAGRRGQGAGAPARPTPPPTSTAATSSGTSAAGTRRSPPTTGRSRCSRPIRRRWSIAAWRWSAAARRSTRSTISAARWRCVRAMPRRMSAPPSAHARLNQVADALAEIDKVLAGDPENRDALLTKVGILREADRAEEALAHRRRDARARSRRCRRACRARPCAAPSSRRFRRRAGRGGRGHRRSAEERRGARGARHGARPARPLRRGLGGARSGRTARRLRHDAASHAGGRASATSAGSRRRSPPTTGRSRPIPTTSSARYHRCLLFLAWGDYADRLGRARVAAEGSQRSAGRSCSSWRRCGRARTSPARRCCSIPSRAPATPSSSCATRRWSRRAAREVSMVVHESLRRLFAANFPDMDVSEHHRHALRLRLPGAADEPAARSWEPTARRRSRATCPISPPIPSASPNGRRASAATASRSASAGRATPNTGSDQFRSIPLGTFAPLAAVPGVRLISVQALWASTSSQTCRRA